MIPATPIGRPNQLACGRSCAEVQPLNSKQGTLVRAKTLKVGIAIKLIAAAIKNQTDFQPSLCEIAKSLPILVQRLPTGLSIPQVSMEAERDDQILSKADPAL